MVFWLVTLGALVFVLCMALYLSMRDALQSQINFLVEDALRKDKLIERQTIRIMELSKPGRAQTAEHAITIRQAMADTPQAVDDSFEEVNRQREESIAFSDMIRSGEADSADENRFGIDG